MGPRPALGRRVPHPARWASTLAGLVFVLLLPVKAVFAGPVYRVCLTQNPGFVNCTVGGDPSSFSGFEIDLLSMVASNLGWVQVNSSTKTSSTSQPAYTLVCTDKRVPAIIDILTNKSNDPNMSDCALGMGAFTATSERVQMGARFSWPHLHSSLGIMVAADTQQTQYDKWAFLKPFSPKIWAAVLLSTILTPCALLLYENVIQTGRIPLGFALLTEWRHASYVMFLCCFNLQVLEVLSWPCQLMVVCFAFSNLIVVASYTANLAAVLTAAVVSTGIQTISDLVNKVVGAHGVYVGRLLKNENIRATPMDWAGEPFFLQVKDQLVQGNLDAYIFDRAILQYWMGADDPSCQLRLLDNTQVEPFDYGVAFNWRLDDTVVRNFSFGVLQVQSTGFLSVLEERYISGAVNACSNQNTYDNALQFGQVAGLYVILGGAAGLGLIMSLYSIWHHHIWKPKRREQKVSKLSRRRSSLRSMNSNMTSDMNVYAVYDRETLPRQGFALHGVGKKAQPLVCSHESAYEDEELDMELKPDVCELKLMREPSELRRDVSGLGISDIDDAQAVELYPSGTNAYHHDDDDAYEHHTTPHEEQGLPEPSHADKIAPDITTATDPPSTIEDGGAPPIADATQGTGATSGKLRRSAPVGDNRRFGSLASVTSAVMAAKRLAQKVFVVEGKEEEDPLAPAPGVMLQRAYAFNHALAQPQLMPNAEYSMAAAAAASTVPTPRGLVSVSNLQASFIRHHCKSFGSRSSKNMAVGPAPMPLMYPAAYMDPSMLPQYPYPHPTFQQQRSFQQRPSDHGAAAAVQLSHAHSMPVNIPMPEVYRVDSGRSGLMYGSTTNSDLAHAMSMSASGHMYLNPTSPVAYDPAGGASSRQSLANYSPPVSQGIAGQEDGVHGSGMSVSRRPSSSSPSGLQKPPSRGRSRWQAALARMPSAAPAVSDHVMAGGASSSSRAPREVQRTLSQGPALQKSWSGRSTGSRVNDGLPPAASPTASAAYNMHVNSTALQNAQANTNNAAGPPSRTLLRTGSGSSTGMSRSSSGRSNPSGLPMSLGKLMPVHAARAPSPLQQAGTHAGADKRVLEGVAEESQGWAHSSSSGHLMATAGDRISPGHYEDNAEDKVKVKSASPGSESGASVNFLPLTPVNTEDIEAGPKMEQ